MKDGGPAFPTLYINGSNGDYYQSTEGGMSLRDYFAAKALQAVIPVCAGDTPPPGESLESYFSQRAYAIADAMLKVRG